MCVYHFAEKKLEELQQCKTPHIFWQKIWVFYAYDTFHVNLWLYWLWIIGSRFWSRLENPWNNYFWYNYHFLEFIQIHTYYCPKADLFSKISKHMTYFWTILPQRLIILYMWKLLHYILFLCWFVWYFRIIVKSPRKSSHFFYLDWQSELNLFNGMFFALVLNIHKL